ncbi:putative transporter MCH2 [Cladobotryum mycophilum]|uniref:Transporter MCH2 n=1 Tax=Cladobotryum mycophilum TaxID=491253 RepID=A0ABR0SK52_9HYPO
MNNDQQTTADTGRTQDQIQSSTQPPPSIDNKGLMGNNLSEKDNQGSTTESQIHESPLNTPEPPPNGGYGWVCTACIAIINGHTWGLNSSYGVFLAHYLDQNTFPGATTLQYAFVGSLSISCAMMVSPLATIGVRELGTKPTMFIGIFLETASLICASFASQIWHLFLTQGVLFGFGMGFLFTPSVGIVPQWFTTRRSLANGISACGSGLGGVIYSFAAGAMIQNLGLGWAFRILGIIAFVVNTVCTLLLRDRNKIIGSSQLAFDTSLLKRAEYVLLVIFGWFSILGYIVLIFSLANYAREIGLRPSQAALVSAFFNLGQGLGRPLIGHFSDRTGRINMAVCTTFMAAVFSLAIWINAKSYGVLIFFALIAGTVGGTFWTVIAPVTAEVVGLKNVPSALNIMWIMIVLPSIFSEPIALQIVAGTGSYLGTQIWTGVMFIAAAAVLTMVRGWKIAELDEIAKARHEAPEHIDPYKIENSEEVSMRSKQVGRKRMFLDCWKKAKV